MNNFKINDMVNCEPFCTHQSKALKLNISMNGVYTYMTIKNKCFILENNEEFCFVNLKFVRVS